MSEEEKEIKANREKDKGNEVKRMLFKLKSGFSNYLRF